MAKLPFKAIVKEGINDILPPSGELKKQISRKDLENYPEKYFNLYPQHYVNADEIRNFLSTRSTVTKSGNKVAFVKGKDQKGNTYNILSGKNKATQSKKIAKTESPSDFYSKMISGLKLPETKKVTEFSDAKTSEAVDSGKTEEKTQKRGKK